MTSAPSSKKAGHLRQQVPAVDGNTNTHEGEAVVTNLQLQDKSVVEDRTVHVGAARVDLFTRDGRTQIDLDLSEATDDIAHLRQIASAIMTATFDLEEGVRRCAVLHVLAVLGVKLVEVDGLALTGCWVRSVRVGLIREGISKEERREVLDYFIRQAHALPDGQAAAGSDDSVSTPRGAAVDAVFQLFAKYTITDPSGVGERFSEADLEAYRAALRVLVEGAEVLA